MRLLHSDSSHHCLKHNSQRKRRRLFQDSSCQGAACSHIRLINSTNPNERESVCPESDFHPVKSLFTRSSCLKVVSSSQDQTTALSFLGLIAEIALEGKKVKALSTISTWQVFTKWGKCFSDQMQIDFNKTAVIFIANRRGKFVMCKTGLYKDKISQWHWVTKTTREEQIVRTWKLTSGVKGGSTRPASRRFQLVPWNQGCAFTPLAPRSSQPSRRVLSFCSNCHQGKTHSTEQWTANRLLAVCKLGVKAFRLDYW